MRQETPGDSWIIAQKAWPLFRKSEISSQGQRQFAEGGKEVGEKPSGFTDYGNAFQRTV